MITLAWYVTIVLSLLLGGILLDDDADLGVMIFAVLVLAPAIVLAIRTIMGK